MAYAYLFTVTLLIPYPSVQHFIWPLHWCLLADICNHTYIPECGTENEEDLYNRRLFIDECDLFEYNCDYETDFYPMNYSSCFNLPPRPCPPIIPCPSIPPCPDHRFHNTSSTGLILVSRFNNKVSKSSVKPTTLGSSTPKYLKPFKYPVNPTTPGSSSPKYLKPFKYPVNPTTPGSSSPKDLKPFKYPVNPTTPGSSPPEYINPSKYPVKPTTLGSSLPMYMLRGKRRYSPTFKKKKRKTTRQLIKKVTVRKTTKKTAPTTRTRIIKKMTVKQNGRVFIKVVKEIIKNRPSKKKNYDSEFLE